MAFTQFYNNVVVDIFESNESLDLGKFTLSSGTELKYVRLVIYKHGSMGGSETATLTITDPDSNVVKATSDAMVISEIEDEGTYWLGWVRFDFSRENLPPDDYRIAISLANYTRNGDTYYIAVVLDQEPKVYTQNGALTADLSIWGYHD